jgi:hypothetical protein
MATAQHYLKFYADTPKVSNYLFTWSTMHYMNSVQRLQFFERHGWRIRAAWHVIKRDNKVIGTIRIK